MNRRQILATTGAIASLGLCAGIVAGVPGCTPASTAEPFDPMADLAIAYTVANETLNASGIDDDAEVEAFCAIHIDPLRDRIMEAAPAPTTMAGALAAVRLAERCAGQGDYQLAEPLIAVVRRYLEGGAA